MCTICAKSDHVVIDVAKLPFGVTEGGVEHMVRFTRFPNTREDR
jgi:hypothetical protein